MKKILWNEIKTQKFILLLFTGVLILITTMSAVFSTISFNCLEATDSIIDYYSFQGDFQFNINNVGSKTIEFFENYDSDAVCYEYAYLNFFNNISHLSTSNSEISEKVSFLYHKDIKAQQLNDNRLLKGNSFFSNADSDNGFVPVWLSKSISLKYNINVSDIIRLKSDNENIRELKVTGIYSDIEGVPDIFVDFKNADALFKSAGVAIQKNVTIINRSYLKSRKLVADLKQNGISYNCQYFDAVNDQIEYYFIFFTVLLAVSFMIMSISVIIFFSYSRLIQFRRNYFIALLLTLGFTRKKIVQMYFCILEFLVLISVIFSAVFDRIIYTYLINIVSEIMGSFLSEQKFPYYNSLYLLIILTVFVSLSSCYLYKKIQTIKEIDITRGIE